MPVEPSLLGWFYSRGLPAAEQAPLYAMAMAFLEPRTAARLSGNDPFAIIRKSATQICDHGWCSHEGRV